MWQAAEGWRKRASRSPRRWAQGSTKGALPPTPPSYVAPTVTKGWPRLHARLVLAPPGRVVVNPLESGKGPP